MKHFLKLHRKPLHNLNCDALTYHHHYTPRQGRIWRRRRSALVFLGFLKGLGKHINIQALFCESKARQLKGVFFSTHSVSHSLNQSFFLFNFPLKQSLHNRPTKIIPARCITSLCNVVGKTCVRPRPFSQLACCCAQGVCCGFLLRATEYLVPSCSKHLNNYFAHRHQFVRISHGVIFGDGAKFSPQEVVHVC